MSETFAQFERSTTQTQKATRAPDIPRCERWVRRFYRREAKRIYSPAGLECYISGDHGEDFLLQKGTQASNPVVVK